MLSEFSPQVKKGALKNLPRHHFYMKPGSLIPQEPYSGVTFPITTVKDNGKKDRILSASRHNFAPIYIPQPTNQQPEKQTMPEKNNSNTEIIETLDTPITLT